MSYPYLSDSSVWYYVKGFEVGNPIKKFKLTILVRGNGNIMTEIWNELRIKYFDSVILHGGTMKYYNSSLDAILEYLEDHNYDLSFLEEIGNNVSRIDIVNRMVKNENLHPHYKITSIKIAPSCEACRIDQPSQWAHCVPGGCMANPDETF